ncbi:hypothetical protein ACFXKS_28420 [Streptomyces scopuliridis]|uniref:hypothetical protein n=1 Tax=Streptomyces scopuliridis TaxID=452529 RepID=UPI00369FED1B
MPATAPERERHGEPGSARRRGQGWRSTLSASLGEAEKRDQAAAHWKKIVRLAFPGRR